jgi:hypothetical protein
MGKRRSIPVATKRKLVDEAGGKCANPGCAAYQIHVHHIREWRVYQAHDPAEMIAICPNCHDAVHRGALRIDDETLYRWKGIQRKADARLRAAFHVEPGPTPKLLLGSIAATGDSGLVVFDLGADRLGFRVEDGAVQLVALIVTSLEGEELVRVIDNRVASDPVSGVRFESHPGRVLLTAPMNDRFLPWWAIQQLHNAEPGFPGIDGRLRLVDVEVLEPGLVRVQGVWAEKRKAIVITEERLHFCRQGLDLPVSLAGEGSASVLHYTGPISSAMFNVE